MEYSVNQLAKLSGVSPRTLRFYDEIGLLCPKRKSGNGYRVYGPAQLDTLQQILFYRELEFSLEDIKRIIFDSSFDSKQALEYHLSSLKIKKQQLSVLINNVEKTIACAKGEIVMNDKEKFDGFKNDLIDKNEEKYGVEIRGKYGDNEIDTSNQKLRNMSKKDWETQKALENEIRDLLVETVKGGNPSCKKAQEMCKLHKDWIMMFWGDGTYSGEAHMALGEGYVSDPRFKAYYDNIILGGAEFLRDALNIYCSKS